jgi:hypothetical protein
MSQETVERTFNVTLPARLVISNIRGSVEIKPGSESEVHVSAVKLSSSGDAARTEIFIDQEADGTVRVETRYHHGGYFLFGDRPCKVEYVVTVPKRCSIDSKGVSSSSLVQGLEGDFHISTISGGVQVKDLAGPVRLNAVSGEVSGEAISGSLDYDTVSGSIRLVESRLTQVKGSSVSGRVWLQTDLKEGPYKIHTVSGGLYLLVPQGTACTVESKAVSGSIVTDLPINRDTRQGGYRQVEIGGGGTLVEFSGVSSNLSILSGEGGQSQAATASQSTAAPDQENPVDANEVLDKIERGEISVDEGIDLLKNKK